MTVYFASKKCIKILFIIIAAVLLIFSVMLAAFFSQNSLYAEYDGIRYNLSAKNPQEHRKFAAQFGCTLSEYPLMIQKVRIPDEFNSIYREYNKLQEQIGLNLYQYAGKKCTLYTYNLENPDYKGKAVFNMLVYNGRVIGGDISSTEYNSFIKSFKETLDMS